MSAVVVVAATLARRPLGRAIVSMIGARYLVMIALLAGRPPSAGTGAMSQST
jgi:hypothetical protein